MSQGAAPGYVPDEACAQCQREIFATLIEINPANSEAIYNLGVLYLCEQRYEEAIETFERAITLRPIFWGALFQQAGAYAKLGQTQEAVERYYQVLAIEPTFNRGYIALANILSEQGQREEALQLLRHGATFAYVPDAIITLLNELNTTHESN